MGTVPHAYQMVGAAGSLSHLKTILVLPVLKLHVHSQGGCSIMGRRCPLSILLFTFLPLGLGTLPGPNPPGSPQCNLERASKATTCDQKAPESLSANQPGRGNTEWEGAEQIISPTASFQWQDRSQSYQVGCRTCSLSHWCGGASRNTQNLCFKVNGGILECCHHCLPWAELCPTLIPVLKPKPPK